MLLRWFEHSQVYHPRRNLDASGAELMRPYDDVHFPTADGMELNGWFYPADAGSQRGGLVFLVCHGNAGNISHRLGLFQALLRTGPAVFGFDYRGYGRSGGRAGEEGTYLDAQAAHAWLRRKGFAARNILAYGESLGGGVGSELCLREPTGGLILQSTFTRMPDIGAELFPWLPVRRWATIHYNTVDKLPRVKVPVLILHSRADDLVGFQHAERNYAARAPKFLRELEGGHNDPAWESKGFQAALEEFLGAVEGKAQS
jgi:pimeloyl-ACP methyl ester carboxylesterase